MQTNQHGEDSYQPGSSWEVSSSRMHLILLLSAFGGLRASEAFSLTSTRWETAPEVSCDETNDDHL
jgi:hypothetical protein